MVDDSLFRADETLIVALEGWSDAGEAASQAAQLIIDHYRLLPVHTVDSEVYFDYHLTRPEVETTAEGLRELVWPGLTLYGPVPELSLEGAPMVLLGVEPTKLWRSLASDILDWAIARDIENVLCVGAMLADVPHSRPVRLIRSSEDSVIRSVLDLERSSYEGPVGFLTVLSMWAKELDLSTLHLWAQVPHYVHTSPSPKATLALLDAVAEVTHLEVPREELLEEAQSWEENIDLLAAEDEDMTAYIHQLERARDTVESPEASGDAIAREFERYLRRGPDRPNGGAAGSDS
jgi:hypothetical protein